MVQIRQDIAQIQRNIDEQTVTNTRTVALIAYRTDEKAKLQQDRDKFEYEQKEITAYLGKLQAVYDETRAELSRLYRTNFPLSEELRTMSEELTREINRRTAEAIAEVDSTRRP
jgi:Skp family chaperone for outer membrane proteins